MMEDENKIVIWNNIISILGLIPVVIFWIASYVCVSCGPPYFSQCCIAPAAFLWSLENRKAQLSSQSIKFFSHMWLALIAHVIKAKLDISQVRFFIVQN